jgi:hypothetical protein
MDLRAFITDVRRRFKGREEAGAHIALALAGDAVLRKVVAEYLLISIMVETPEPRASPPPAIQKPIPASVHTSVGTMLAKTIFETHRLLGTNVRLGDASRGQLLDAARTGKRNAWFYERLAEKMPDDNRATVSSVFKDRTEVDMLWKKSLAHVMKSAS